jgi:nitroimidazol reductase NimA-like FMN-containing flavoprotein (pyridoxamine 5'-phosphate oxidase superfamily)
MCEDEIEALIREEKICRIAFRGEKTPYLIPFQYVVMNGRMYFHFTDYGRKMSLLRRSELVCVEIERFTPDMSQYRFVVITGSLEIVKDQTERTEAIRAIVETGTGNLSANFVAVHGFKKEDGWSSLTADKPMIIVKLAKVTERIGLKSP